MELFQNGLLPYCEAALFVSIVFNYTNFASVDTDSLCKRALNGKQNIGQNSFIAF